MLTSLLGIRLVLLLGKTIPVPASYDVATALVKVEVTNDAKTADGFQITFSLGKGILNYSLLQGGTFDPGTRVVIGVILGAIPEVLIDGIITHHQVTPSNDPGMSTLTVTGTDVSIMLDLEEKNLKYENQPDSVIFTRLIAAYAKYGLVPTPTPTPDIPIVVQRIPRQQETDLKFIQRMAQRNGFVFYIEPVTFLVNTAYFGPETRAGLPQPALSMELGPSTNCDSLNFSEDGLAPVMTKGTFTDPITKVSIPILSPPSLKLPPLALYPTAALRTVLLRNTANQDAGQAAVTAAAAVTNAPDAVTGQGKLDTVRYGSILRARKLVGVRGAGFSYDGNYFVQRVTHSIARGQYTQSFTISREGTGALLPAVIP
jgi:hypothetical protein